MTALTAQVLTAQALTAQVLTLIPILTDQVKNSSTLRLQVILLVVNQRKKELVVHSEG